MKLYEYQRSRSFIDLGPNHSDSIFLNFFSSITADFNISSALKWVVQDQWSCGLTIGTNFYLTGFNSFLEIYSFSILPYKTKGIKFDLAVNRSRSARGNHLNRFGSTLVTQCHIPSFKVISLLVPEKKNFKGFYHIWASWSFDLDEGQWIY